MNIKNQTNRTIEVQVAGKSSQTLWTTTVPAGQSVGKDLPEDDKPYTPYGRWQADPALRFNFLLSYNPSRSVPDNRYTVVVEDTVPSFVASVTG